MKKEFKLFSYLVTDYDINLNKIKYYDILKYREDDIKKMKKQCSTKEEFSEALRREMMYRFWSKAEYELIIRLTEDGRVILRPWCGCRNPDDVEIDVSDRTDFDWVGFAEKHINKRYGNEAKVDIYDQLTYGDNWTRFIDFVYNYHHKWQRRKVNEI